MSSTTVTRSSVLGKRPHQPAATDFASSSISADPTLLNQCPLTPEPTPKSKRVKISNTVHEGDGNKENIPPFKGDIISSPTTGRAARALRRTSTESITPPHSSRSRNVRRYASTSNLASSPATPATRLNSLSLTTPPPSPPSVLIPLHARARALLRPTCNSTTGIAGREQEHTVIKHFISSFLASDNVASADHSVLYISGSPGTGKTALVNALLHTLDPEIEQCHAKVLSVNCMALESIDSVWERLAEELADGAKLTKGAKARKAKASSVQAVEALLAERQSKCIIVLDELDHIASSPQALSAIFSIAQANREYIRLIGIANTHTLTSSTTSTISTHFLQGVSTCHFAPYTAQQLLEILNARLAPLFEEENFAKTLPTAVLTLLSKKIASQTGDVRATFEVLRGAIDLAVAAASSPSDPLSATTPTVTPAQILAALKAYAPMNASRPSGASSVPNVSNSETVTKVRELGLHARIVLLAMLLAVKRLEAGLSLCNPTSQDSATSRSPTKRSGTPPVRSTGMQTSQLYTYYTSLLSQGSASFTPVSRSDFTDLLGVLETVGLVSLSNGPNCGSLPGTPTKSGRKPVARVGSFSRSKNSTQSIGFVEGLRMDEVSRGLGLSATETASEDVREEEVRSLWTKESVRIAREIKAQGITHAGSVFDQATED